MTQEALQLFSSNLYYGPRPALVVDTGGRVVDYNLALEAIFGDLLNGWRYLPIQELCKLLNEWVSRGELISADGTHESTAECYVLSPGLGTIHLTSSTVTCSEASTGQKIGQILSWDFISPTGNESFHERYRSMLDQQLIWETYAWSYDRILPLIPYYQDVTTRHVNFLMSSCKGPIIDLGAGTGNLAQQLIIKGRAVTAVDSSRAMIQKLRSKPLLLSVLGRQLTVIEGRAESLPMIADQSYAGASLQLALFDMGSPELGLRTAIRVLRPGGRIVVTDLKRHFELEPILQECENQLRNLGLRDKLADDLQRVVRSNHDLAPGSRSVLRIEDVFDTLSAHGFEGLETRDSHLGQCATVTATKPRDADLF